MERVRKFRSIREADKSKTAKIIGFFSHDIISTIVTFAVTVLIIPAYLAKDDLADSGILGVLTYTPVIVYSVVYIILMVLFKRLDSRLNNNEVLQSTFRHTIQHMDLIHDGWAERLQELVNRSQSEGVTLAWFQRDFKEHADFSSRAKRMCLTLCEVISKSFNIDDHQISLMMPGCDEHGDYIQMIVYENTTKEVPGSHLQRFYLDDHRDYFHVRIFKKNSGGIRVLNGKKEIEKRFVYPKSSDEPIKVKEQYIAIPVADPRTKKVLFVVQVDTTTKGVFGSNEAEMRYFAKMVLLPFCLVLRIWYTKFELSTELEKIS